jgi:predicted O-linked N-acetylglucosamine transferase (SPINDLY family)
MNEDIEQAKHFFLLGMENYQDEAYEDAEYFLEMSLNFFPDRLSTLTNLCAVLIKLGKLERASELITKAISLYPFDEAILLNQGNLFEKNKNWEMALISYTKAIELKSNYVEAHFNSGNVLKQLKRFAEALVFYDQAISIKNDHIEAHLNRGDILSETRFFDDALASYTKAIDFSPVNPTAYLIRGNCLRNLRKLNEAIADYEKAIELKTEHVEAYFNLGLTLKELNRFDEAIRFFEQALKLKPDFEYLPGFLLHTKMCICDWLDFETTVESLATQINKGQKFSPSLAVFALVDSLNLHSKSSKIWMNDKHPSNQLPISFSKNFHKEKIKIGYYSADFHNHATAYLMAELFERHDKTKFELVAFSFGPDSKDSIRQRLYVSFDKFIDVRFKSDKDIALISRSLGIDIAIDLKGFTRDERANIFAYRAAPIQVSYIGYPGSMMAEYIDYIIADPTLIPVDSQKFYSEKIVYLPNSYQVNDRKRVIKDKVFTKNELGLPEECFVFCCFNNNYKITPKIFDGWIRILKAVPGSILWLMIDNNIASLNLRKESEARGLDPNRLFFAKKMELSEHLARHRAADLFLDTHPYNAHTTASDALWTGLPVLTFLGESFPSRVAASLLNAIGLTELITRTQQEYEALAIELATNPVKLESIKNKLDRNKLSTALFDTPLFTMHIEDAYMQMHERYKANLSPDHIFIKNL